MTTVVNAKILTTLVQKLAQFPSLVASHEEIPQPILLSNSVRKFKADRNPTRIKKRLAAIVTTIGVLASGISGVADFTKTTIDLGEKLNIDVPALMGK